MPEISVRGLEMPESPIRKLAPLAAAAKKKGTKVYHLNIGQPDLPTPQVGLDALKQIDRNILEYSPSQGYLSYREKLVSYYAKYDINVTAEEWRERQLLSYPCDGWCGCFSCGYTNPRQRHSGRRDSLPSPSG